MKTEEGHKASGIARRVGIKTNQLYNWKKQCKRNLINSTTLLTTVSKCQF